MFSWPTHPSETNVCFETVHAENRNSNVRRAEENLGTTLSSFLNLNKYCSFRLLYSWKVPASLKAWFKLWLSRFRWNVTVSRRVPGGGGGEALCYFASTGYPEQGTGFQGHRLMFVTAVLFLLKLQEHFQLSLLQ